MTQSERLKRLLAVGYFPKELPPAFVTHPFARWRASLAKEWPPQGLDQWKSVPEPFSIPKLGHARRMLAIVNPISQFKIADLISKEWTFIRRHVRSSPISEFVPLLDMLGERAVFPPNYIEIDRRRARVRALFPRALSSDITRFYGSIYTHSVAWALHGKDWSKQHLNTPALNQSVGGRLDRALRQSQDNQTIGIAIGPDTSRIVAETIATAIDKSVFPGGAKKTTLGLRYVDDYFIGIPANSSDTAVSAKLSAALREFELEINAAKTSGDSLGETERPQWIRRFQASSLWRGASIESIRDYFDEIVSLFATEQNEAIPKYALKKSRSFAIPQESIQYYLDRLLHIARICPGSIPVMVQTILDRKSKNQQFETSSIKKFVVESIDQFVSAGCTFEVTWLLYLARGIGLKLTRSEVASVFRFESSPPALVLMDMNARGLISRGIDQTHWKRAATAQALEGPMWLLAYEAVLKNWWPAGTPTAYVSTHPLFGPLLKRGIYFYDEKKNVKSTFRELLDRLAATRRYRYLFTHQEDYF